jgi:hypothetical protein
MKFKGKLATKWAKKFGARLTRIKRDRRAKKPWDGQQSGDAMTIDEYLEIENTPQPPRDYKPRESKKRARMAKLAGMNPKIFLEQRFGKCTVNSEDMRMKGAYMERLRDNFKDQKEWYRKPPAEYLKAVKDLQKIKSSGKTSEEVAARQQKVVLKERVIYQTFLSPLDRVIQVPQDMDIGQFSLDPDIPYSERSQADKATTWRLYHGARVQYLKLLNEMLAPDMQFGRDKLDYYEGFFRLVSNRQNDQVQAYPIPLLELSKPEDKRAKGNKLSHNITENTKNPEFSNVNSRYFFSIKTWFVFRQMQP